MPNVARHRASTRMVDLLREVCDFGVEAGYLDLGVTLAHDPGDECPPRAIAFPLSSVSLGSQLGRVAVGCFALAFYVVPELVILEVREAPFEEVGF
ncbi:hypothetical protein ASF96_04910 [Microbacterium sp. Leaf179]|nr:hypothetical protein ASF96_04910 [Microbacterium sp. Leaf179]